MVAYYKISDAQAESTPDWVVKEVSKSMEESREGYGVQRYKPLGRAIWHTGL